MRSVHVIPAKAGIQKSCITRHLPRFIEKIRFLVHCFKYDLEVLLLVVDTGVLISAFAFRGIPERVVRKAFTEAEVWISPQLLREYRDTPIEPEADGTITHTQLRALLSGALPVC